MTSPSDVVQKRPVRAVVTSMLDEELPALEGRIAQHERTLTDLRQYRDYLLALAAVTGWKKGDEDG